MVRLPTASSASPKRFTLVQSGARFSLGRPQSGKCPQWDSARLTDFFTNCRSYPKCWEDASQHNLSSGAFSTPQTGLRASVSRCCEMTRGAATRVLAGEPRRRSQACTGQCSGRHLAHRPRMSIRWAFPTAPGVTWYRTPDCDLPTTDYGSFSEPVVLSAHLYGYMGPTPNLIGSDGKVYRAFEASVDKLIVMTKAIPDWNGRSNGSSLVGNGAAAL